MNSPRAAGVAVGTSGWSYADWAGPFYPASLPRSRWLEHYVAHFPTAEVNYSFYRLPSTGTVARWRGTAPNRFRFALKGSRYITHVRRLAGTETEVANFMARARGLRSFLGVVLWQLPKGMARDLVLLERFVSTLPAGVRHAIEFRDPSWLADDAFAVLRRHRVAHVAVSSPGMPRNLTITAEFVYVRFHGLTGFAHDYTPRELAPWVAFLREAHARGLPGYAYFNNDVHARAPKNAAQLIEALGDAAVPWP